MMIQLMFRFGYTNPVNYNDNELYCGGFSVQWDQVRIIFLIWKLKLW